MEPNDREFPWKLVIFFVLLKLSFHFFTNTNYELHRDAYLYLAQSHHLSWGFISVPPFTAFLTAIFRDIFGESLFALRLMPAIVGGLTTFVISLSVWQLGGGIWALILANTSYLFSISYLRTNTLLQPVSIDIFFWVLAFYIVIRLLKTGNPRYWIPFAIATGTGFLNKYSMAFLAVGFFAALILTPQRKLLNSRYFFLALLTGSIIILPNVIWQYLHNWPVLYHYEMLNKYQLVNVQLDDFLTAQVLMNVNGIIIWMAGIIFLLFHKEAIKYRAIAITYFTVMLILILTRGKHYYTLGLYPILLAAGGVGIERYFRNKVLKYSMLAYAVLISIPFLPVGLPVLNLRKMIRYGDVMKNMGLDMILRWEDGRLHSLPQDYADMTGWEELAGKVIRIYGDLSGEEKAHCAIYAENYGQAGAISFFGRKAGLPDVICFNGSFVFWAPDNIDGTETIIYVNDEIEELKMLFGTITEAGSISDPYARETGLPIWVCRDPSQEFYQLYRTRVSEEKSRFMKNKP